MRVLRARSHERVSLTLTEDLTLKRIAPLDVLGGEKTLGAA